MHTASGQQWWSEPSAASYAVEPPAPSPVVSTPNEEITSMPDKNEHTGRFGGPGSSHQDKENPGKNKQEHGHKDGGGKPGSEPDRMKNADGDDSDGGHRYREHGRT